MKVVLCGGGTAGHINPALSIGAKLKAEQPDVELLYVGAAGGMEETLVPKAGLEFRSIHVMGFRRSLSPKDMVRNIKAIIRAVTSQREAKKILKEFSPDMVVGTGGYVSGPVVLQATKMGIKTAIHEQNAYPGVTSKLLAPKVTRVMVAVPKALEYFDDKEKCVVVGNPVRAEIFTADRASARRELNVNHGRMILSFGGSLGAHAVNEAVADLIRWEGERTDILHMHATGSAGKAEFDKMLQARKVDTTLRSNVRIREYIDNMPQMLAAADLVICRAGASTLAELEAMGKASILIPYPFATENHQMHNARVLEERGGCIVIDQKDLTGEKLIQLVSHLMDNPGELTALGQNAKAGAIENVADKIYGVLTHM